MSSVNLIFKFDSASCFVQIFINCLNPPADVNSWLVTFGFQLYNVIPGYHKPNTEAIEPSYELVRTQIKTQEWDSTKVMFTSP